MDGTDKKYQRRWPLVSLIVWVQKVFAFRRRNFLFWLGCVTTCFLCLLCIHRTGGLFISKLWGAWRVTINASPISVKRNSPFQCNAPADITTITDQSFAFPTNEKKVVQGFPHTPVLTDQFLDPTTAHDSVLFQARSSKFPNGPILSTGSSMLINSVKDEFRLLQVKAFLNYTAIQDTEGVESDVCVTVMPQGQVNSVSSGQEMFCTHEAYFGGDPKPISERSGPGRPPYLNIWFGPNGIRLKSGDKLDVASVSQIFTPEWMKPLGAEDVAARDAPPESDQITIPGIGKVKTSLDLLSLNFEATIVPVTPSEILERPRLRSARIPHRDRSSPPWIPSEDAFPLTAYQNSADHPVTIRGLGIFRSMLQHYNAGDTLIRVLVDGEEVQRYCPPPHRPTETSAPFDDVIPVNVVVQPGQVVRVEHTLSAYLPDRYKYRVKLGQKDNAYHWPAHYDLAIFVLYDHGEASTKDTDSEDDALVPFEEMTVPGGENHDLDLNGDGHPELIDYDAVGTVWTDLTHPDGSRDTQHAAIRNLITNKGRFNQTTTTWTWTRNTTTTYMEAKVTDEAEGICFYLRAKHAAVFSFEYCDESNVPYKSFHEVDHAFGDFDGDGHFDRVRLVRENIFKNTCNLNLYFAKGDGKQYLHERFVGSIHEGCFGGQVTLVSTFLASKGRHVVGYNSRCSEFDSVAMETLAFGYNSRCAEFNLIDLERINLA